MVLPKKGDIIRFPRGGYDHYGIYVGNGRIIHRAGPPGGPSSAPASTFSVSGAKSDKAEIREDKLEDVMGDKKEAEIFNYLDRNSDYKAFHPDDIVKRARSKLGQQGYNLLFQNCEHFVTWCRYGVEVSAQVDRLKPLIAVFSPTTFLIMELVQAVRNATNPN